MDKCVICGRPLDYEGTLVCWSCQMGFTPGLRKENRMKEKILDRLASVKSIVTIALTIVFAYLAVTGAVSGNEFLTVFTVVISFYFGTQARKEGDRDES